VGYLNLFTISELKLKLSEFSQYNQFYCILILHE